MNPGTKGRVKIVVDRDPHYRATTTGMAIDLLLRHHGISTGSLLVEQSMQVPVGCGFGASAAAAISGVYAVAKVLGLEVPRRDLAYHAHVAEIVQQTGLGTVSVTFKGVGAGAITKAGSPGSSRFLNVEVPKGIRLVTASLAPFRKRDALSRADTTRKINWLGDRSLRRLVADPTLDRLAEEGERFSEKLGLMTPEVGSLVETAKSAGATHASQNMIGHAIHALSSESLSAKVAHELKASPLQPRVDVLEIGSERAHAFSSTRSR